MKKIVYTGDSYLRNSSFGCSQRDLEYSNYNLGKLREFGPLSGLIYGNSTAVKKNSTKFERYRGKLTYCEARPSWRCRDFEEQFRDPIVWSGKWSKNWPRSVNFLWKLKNPKFQVIILRITKESKYQMRRCIKMNYLCRGKKFYPWLHIVLPSNAFEGNLPELGCLPILASNICGNIEIRRDITFLSWQQRHAAKPPSFITRTLNRNRPALFWRFFH